MSSDQKQSQGWSKFKIAMIPAAVFFIFCLIDIHSPGLYFDEIFMDNLALRWTGNTGPCWAMPDNILATDNSRPLLGTPYCGLLSGMMSLPFYSIFGRSVFSARIAHTFWGMMIYIVLALHLLTPLKSSETVQFESKQFFAPIIFFILFMCINPGLTWIYRTQVQNDVIPIFFFVSAVFLMHQDFHRRLYLLVSGLFLGIACYGYFLYFIFSAPVVLVVFYKLRKKLYSFFLFMVAFAIGVLPYIYGVMSMALNRHSIQAVFGNTVGKFGNEITLYQKFLLGLEVLSNTFSNIGMQVITLGRFFSMSVFQLYICYILIAMVTTFIILDLFKKQYKFSSIETAGYFIAPICLFLSLLRLIPGLNTHHIYAGLILFYFGALLYITRFLNAYIPFSFNGMHHLNLNKKISYGLICGFFLFCGTINMVQLVLMHKQLRQSGGAWYFSDATYRTVEFCRSRYPDSKIFFAGWGLWAQASFLTNGKMDYDLSIDYNYLKTRIKKNEKTVVVWSFITPEENIESIVKRLKNEFDNHRFMIQDNGLHIEIIEFNLHQDPATG